ncbi:Bro-N domain-containing protein [Haematospirillum sp. 15-248]|uniref:BRO-N domain-containing protein n=1 Tax=Haematospirillum sp. 15-248 TaxID=2723107 RepID=UPI001438ED1C|nr:Bro-N domain-containing protein [Haematospirillum sp. 15-248]NKD88173.1 Bro-N domain-containing protein [Haematospirillum sp. 15-248]
MHRNNATTENNGVAVIPFAFEGCRVRAIVDKNGEPWFVAKDIATILGYERTADAVRAHCKARRKAQIPTQGGLQEMIIIPEQDVCRLVMRSRLPGAERFEKWIASKINTFLPVTL